MRYIQSTPKAIAVTTRDATEHLFHFVKRTAIYSGQAAGKGLHGLKAVATKGHSLRQLGRAAPDTDRFFDRDADKNPRVNAS